MEHIILNHLNVIDVAKHNVFASVNNLSQLVEAVKSYGLEAGEAGSESYNDRVGHAYEVYAEFWLKRHGNEAGPDINEVTHTSDNKFERGLDFWFKRRNGNRGVLQVKFRSNPTNKFNCSSLYSLSYVMLLNDIEKFNGAVMFTNLEHTVTNEQPGIFEPSFRDALKLFRVIDKSSQAWHIDRNPTFWSDLRDTVTRSTVEPTFENTPSLWDHQETVWNQMLDVLNT